MVCTLYYIFITFISLYFIIMYEKIKEVIERLERNYEFNDYIMNYLDKEELDKVEIEENLIDLLNIADEEWRLTNVEVIYYARAIDFLSVNDKSLKESLELAKEQGYTIDNINSELLASLLKSDMNKEDYRKFIDQVVEEVFQEGN